MNVTDGLDGLAAGSALFGFIAFTVIAFWGFRNPDIYSIVNPLDLAVLAVSLPAACAGFLWWNAAPARIFMGDIGALGLGAALGLARHRHQHAAAAADHLRPAGDRRSCRWSSRWASTATSAAAASSRWRRSTTTSSWSAGRRRRSSSASG